MEQSGDTYQATIPALDVTVEGLSYYITASDGSTSATYPVSDPEGRTTRDHCFLRRPRRRLLHLPGRGWRFQCYADLGAAVGEDVAGNAATTPTTTESTGTATPTSPPG